MISGEIWITVGVKADMSDSTEAPTLQERVDRLKELTEFTENCKQQIQDIIQTLGWSQDQQDQQDQNKEVLEQCPFDPDHRVPERSMEKHKAFCSLRKMGYTAEEQEELVDPAVCYENTSVRTFTMDKPTQHQVILQARSAAPLMRMEGVFWQGVSSDWDMLIWSILITHSVETLTVQMKD
ncbi:U11/U12 small nuclear ribonucleoprotein 48 kDa protein-like [Notolabrus celidotus]|uniref:U11/U12 small nuclear ribonucleoprotein 48 kDa protein-like n=1 Tax=Notolabrus celidotus TaxID=1203425 RepID=UPI0014900E98|nr:U11/U12 small nuclear ribonucleoprotein 48 kDa protein-like [Notolabrus celidotus]